MAQGGYKFLFDLEADRGARVFLDPTFYRRRRIRRSVLAIACIIVAWMTLFLDGALSIRKTTEEIRLWWSPENLPVTQTAPRQDSHIHKQAKQTHPVANTLAGKSETCSNSAHPVFSANAEDVGMQFFGHVPIELEWAPLSLESSCGVLDVLVPDWLSITPSDEGLIVNVESESVREPVEAYLKRAAHRPQNMPTVSLEPGFDLDGFLEQLSTSTTVSTISHDLVTAARRVGAAGICLDFRQLDKMQLTALDTFFKRSCV